MKTISTLFFLVFSGIVSAQVCAINFSETAPGIYPDTMPTGSVGQPYATDITFVMPTDTMGYDFTNFKILSVSLPVGLTWQCNEYQNDCNYNPQINQYGCVHVSGTPLLAGQYNVDVSVVADLTIAQGIPVTFQVFFEILPTVVNTTNDGFSMSGASGCTPLTVTFTNNNPGLLAYTWDFGNGNTSSLENPAPQVYTTPGDYIVQYEAYDNQTPLDVYTLTQVDVTAMSNYGGGFPSYENADAYFILKENGTAIYQSMYILDQDPPVSWPSLSINLNPANTYVIEIYDADESAGEVYFGADDYMGAHTMNLNGCNGCTAGTSTINYMISHQVINPTPVVVSVDTIHVYPFPDAPVIAYDALTYTLSTPDLGDAYQWYLNGELLVGAVGPSIVVDQSGIYSVLAINGGNCTNTSNEIDVLYCDPAIDPIVGLSEADVLTVGNYPEGLTVSWWLNGQEIVGETGQTLQINSAGNYTAVVADSFGCTYTSEVFTSTLGIDELTMLDWRVYPNPAKDFVTIEVFNTQQVTRVELMDLSGRIIVKQAWITGESTALLNVSDLPAGYFLLNVVGENRMWTKRVVIE